MCSFCCLRAFDRQRIWCITLLHTKKQRLLLQLHSFFTWAFDDCRKIRVYDFFFFRLHRTWLRSVWVVGGFLKKALYRHWFYIHKINNIKKRSFKQIFVLICWFTLLCTRCSVSCYVLLVSFSSSFSLPFVTISNIDVSVLPTPLVIYS